MEQETMIGGINAKGAAMAAQAQMQSYQAVVEVELAAKLQADAYAGTLYGQPATARELAAFENSYRAPETKEEWFARLKRRVEQLEALDIAMPRVEHEQWVSELDAWAQAGE